MEEAKLPSDAEGEAKQQRPAPASREPVTKKALSKLLECMMGVQTDEMALPKYAYPSAGSLYPVQLYLYVREGGVGGLAHGTYYYHRIEHRVSGTAQIRKKNSNRSRSLFRPCWHLLTFLLLLLLLLLFVGSSCF